MALRSKAAKRPATVIEPRRRVSAVGGTGSAADFVPPNASLSAMKKAAAVCRGCHLYENATQTVFGEGPRGARVMFVGEQPGDAEDKAGKPFVGASGRLLDRAMDAAGIDRDDAYVTNAVKHFKWAKDASGKRRIHKSPSRGEVRACFPWLGAEIARVQPEIIVCLGATAAKALIGPSFSVMKHRGIAQKTDWAPTLIATVHPSAVLRAPAPTRQREERAFIADLTRVSRLLSQDNRKRSTGRSGKFSAWSATEAPSPTSSAQTRSSRA
jgi:uracil-DNA glycosylase